MTIKVLICGEAYGVQEARTDSAFVGPSGIELLRMLDEAQLIALTAVDRDYMRRFYQTEDSAHTDCIWRLHPEIVRTNVFNIHPLGNDIDELCGPKSDAIKGWSSLSAGKYVSARYRDELHRLDREIAAADPNLVLALGNTPLWALCNTTKISKLRGTTRLATHVAAGRKVLPVYHPAAVLRDWSLRPVTILDLHKARRESEFPDVRRPQREIWIEPSIADIRRFFSTHCKPGGLLSVDIETSGTRVTCIGFAPSANLALVVPFDDPRAKGRSYWPDRESEEECVKACKDVLSDRSRPKLFQNGLYDIAFLWRSWRCPVRGAGEDSMLLAHALQPELPKGLGFLGSCYTDEGAWKTERRAETIKRDD